MPRGRPPKPIALHLAQGTARKDRHGDLSQVQGDGKVPRCPVSLSPDARRYWNSVVRLLAGRAALNSEMRGPLTLLCQAWGEMAELNRELAKKRKSNDVDPIYRTLLSQRRQAQQVFVRLVAEFGMTPVSVARMQIGTKPTGGIAKTTPAKEAKSKWGH